MANAKKVAALVGIAAIVAATQSAAGFMMVPEAEARELVTQGLVEVNEDNKSFGKIAARATGVAISQVNAGTAGAAASDATTSQAAAPAAAKVNYVIEDNVPLPAAAARGRVGALKYPFDQLGVNQSFFVPGGDAKKLGSTVSSANARYTEVIPGQTRINRNKEEVPATKQTRKFKAGAVDGGARIWRVL